MAKIHFLHLTQWDMCVCTAFSSVPLSSLDFFQKLNEFMGNAFITHKLNMTMKTTTTTTKAMVMSGFLLLIKALTSEGGINCLFYFIIFYNKAQTMLKKFFKAFSSYCCYVVAADVTRIPQVFLNFMHTIFSLSLFLFSFSGSCVPVLYTILYIYKVINFH